MDNVQEISSNEFEALRLSLNKAQLRKRLNDAKRVLKAEYRAMFKPGIFKASECALYSDTPFGYRLQWQTRPQPDAPESYENQQTAIGTVLLIKLSPVAAENAVIDARGCSRETACLFLTVPDDYTPYDCISCHRYAHRTRGTCYLCGDPQHARGLCNKHYLRLKHRGSPHVVRVGGNQHKAAISMEVAS